MIVAVYLPLAAPVLAAICARRLSERLDPRYATWLLTTICVVLAACSSAALALLAAAGFARLPVAAALGHWSLVVLRHDEPTTTPVGLAAGALLAAGAFATTRALSLRIRALLDAYRQARDLPGRADLVVTPDTAAEAFALPGRPGRVVVSTGMLQALTPAERRALLAHEQAHLDCRHHLFVAYAHLASTLNPLLRPLAAQVRYTVERWADEVAAAATGDRRLTAHAVGRAALAATRPPHPHRTRHPALAAVPDLPSLHGAGPVPHRVAALLRPAPHRRLVVVAVTAAGLAATAFALVDATTDLHSLIEIAQRAATR